MRLTLLALLCAGTVAFCQSPAPQKVDPDKLFQIPKKFVEPAQPGFTTFKPLPVMKNDFILERPTILPPRLKLNDAPQIDPKIIVRPPWHIQSKGQEVSHHLFPGLKFLPLQHDPQMSR